MQHYHDQKSDISVQQLPHKKVSAQNTQVLHNEIIGTKSLQSNIMSSKILKILCRNILAKSCLRNIMWVLHNRVMDTNGPQSKIIIAKSVTTLCSNILAKKCLRNTI